MDTRTFIRNEGFNFVSGEAATKFSYHYAYMMPFT